MNVELKRVLMSALAALATFLITLFIKIPFFIGLLLAVVIYIGVYMITKPVMKIGDLEIEKLAQGEELLALLDSAKGKMKSINTLIAEVDQKELKDNANKFSKTSQNLILYLEKNPQKITKARRFLTYILDTGRSILENTVLLEDSEIEDERVSGMKVRAGESMLFLNEATEDAYINLMEDRITDMDIEIDLIENYLKQK